jgi:hypothetical protein
MHCNHPVAVSNPNSGPSNSELSMQKHNHAFQCKLRGNMSKEISDCELHAFARICFESYSKHSRWAARCTEAS